MPTTHTLQQCPPPNHSNVISITRHAPHPTPQSLSRSRYHVFALFSYIHFSITTASTPPVLPTCLPAHHTPNLSICPLQVHKAPNSSTPDAPVDSRQKSLPLYTSTSPSPQHPPHPYSLHVIQSFIHRIFLSAPSKYTKHPTPPRPTHQRPHAQHSLTPNSRTPHAPALLTTQPCKRHKHHTPRATSHAPTFSC